VQPGKEVTFGGAYNVTVTSNPAWEMFLLENLEIEGPLKKHAKDTIRQREVLLSNQVANGHFYLLFSNYSVTLWNDLNTV